MCCASLQFQTVNQIFERAEEGETASKLSSSNTVTYSQSIQKGVATQVLITAQKNEVACENKDDEALLESVWQSFQQLSLVELTPLEGTERKFWTILTRRKKAELMETDNPQQFKTSLTDVLNSFHSYVKSDATSRFVDHLVHDLKNKNLKEIFVKYVQQVQKEANGTLLDEIQAYLGEQERVQLLISQETEALPEKILSHFDWGAQNRDSLMAMLIHYKRQKHPHFNCHIVDIYDFQDLLQSLGEAVKKVDGGPQRYQLLVRNDVHYTAVDIQYTEEGLEAVIMDAAGDEKCEIIASYLKTANCRTVYILGLEDKIQYDFFNCAYFSFDSVFLSGQDPNFFALLKGKPFRQLKGCHSLTWRSMPPKYVRNATSTTFMQAYHSHNSDRTALYKGKDTFEDYVNRHQDLQQIKEQMKPFHTVLRERINKQKNKIAIMLAEMSAQEVADKVYSYSAQAFMQSMR